MYTILVYKTEKGENLLQEFLKTLDSKTRAKIEKYIELLSLEGPNLKRPYADYLESGIYELRVKFSPNNYRILYFFFFEKNIVLTHGFVKKTDSVPVKEIEKALKYKIDYEKRQI